VLSGGGTYWATVVGEETFAARITAEARRYRPATSELRTGINRILVAIGFAIPPLGILLVLTQLRTQPVLTDALRGSVAGLITLVPEGLVLLTSVAFAAAVVRLGRRRVLVQELAAVETLARVDVVCLDKTGTLTDGEIVLAAVEPLTAAADAGEALAAWRPPRSRIRRRWPSRATVRHRQVGPPGPRSPSRPTGAGAARTSASGEPGVSGRRSAGRRACVCARLRAGGLRRPGAGAGRAERPARRDGPA
jgi:magnesium-transporting ATPase (P-type)